MNETCERSNEIEDTLVGKLLRRGVEEILDYLKTACELESGSMKLDKLMKHINWKIAQLEQKDYPEFKPPNINIEQERADTESSARLVGFTIGGIVGVAFEFVREWSLIGTWSLWIVDFIVWAIAAFLWALVGAGIGTLISWGIGFLVGTSRSSAKEAENKAAKEKWEAEIAQEKKVDAEAVADFRSSSLPISELRVLYEQMLDAHYSDGPIYQKYRTLPAVCQLYEYFDSGRFTELGDAYNQYELEVRLNRLVDNSEKALRVLYEIRDTQRLLYDALLDVRDSIESINENIDRCFETLNRIAYSQEVSSICLRQTALATTLLSQIEFYKNRHELPLSLDIFESALIGINAKLLSQARRIR